MLFCQKCGDEFPLRMVIDGKQRNFQRRKYCLTCSPFKTHNTRRLERLGQDSVPRYKRCSGCRLTKASPEFYRRRGTGLTSKCKRCIKIQRREQQRAFKRACIEYKGDKCEHCGYDEHPAALGFHHPDPARKKFKLSQSPNRSGENLTDEIKAELDKCILLCANHHRIWHYEHESQYK